MSEEKKSVKVRLAEKYAKASFDTYANQYGQPTVEEALARAYVAGFDRAKALCVDAVTRFCDEFVPDDGSGKKISEHIATIGELP